MHPTSPGSPAPPEARHVPRVCASCGKPMSGQGDACWNCETVWTDPSTAGGS